MSKPSPPEMTAWIAFESHNFQQSSSIINYQNFARRANKTILLAVIYNKVPSDNITAIT